MIIVIKFVGNYIVMMVKEFQLLEKDLKFWGNVICLNITINENKSQLIIGFFNIINKLFNENNP